jgi:putative tricarboxylic transport membrane protein
MFFWQVEKMKLNDMVWGVMLMVLGVFVLADVRTYPSIPGQQYGPNAFPGLLAALLIGCAVILFAKGWRERANHPWFEAGAWLRSPLQVRNFAITVAGLVFYIIAAEKLGFLVCGSAMLAALFWSLRVRPALILPIAVISSFVIHAIFYKGLRVPLPWGIVPILY